PPPLPPSPLSPYTTLFRSLVDAVSLAFSSCLFQDKALCIVFIGIRDEYVLTSVDHRLFKHKKLVFPVSVCKSKSYFFHKNCPLSSFSCTGLSVHFIRYQFLRYMKVIQIPLQDKYCCYLINVFLAVFSSHTAFDQSSLRLNCSESLIPHNDLKSCPSMEHLLKFQRLFRALPDIIVHMFWKTKHDLFHAVL